MLDRTHVRSGFAISFTVMVVIGSACASEPKPRPATLDPSSPAGPEAPRLEVKALGAEPQEAAEDGPGGKPETQPGIVYTCPMHPEVTSDKPGRCPKCGMKLVPKEPSTPKGKK